MSVELSVLTDYLQVPSPITPVEVKVGGSDIVTIYIKRDDLIHPFISGNKWRKVKHYLLQEDLDSKDVLVSFGGAYSNHLVALAEVGRLLNLKTLAFVRSYSDSLENSSLTWMKERGMQVQFVNPQTYLAVKTKPGLKLAEMGCTKYCLIPEGGAGMSALKGVEELYDEIIAHLKQVDIFFCAIGTGTTYAGLSHSIKGSEQLIGTMSIKGPIHSLPAQPLISPNQQKTMILESSSSKSFGKYCKDQVMFINAFYKQHRILLDPLYTAPAMQALMNQLKSGKIDRSKRIVFIHSGGTQGIMGYNERYSSRPQIFIPPQSRLSASDAITGE